MYIYNMTYIYIYLCVCVSIYIYICTIICIYCVCDITANFGEILAANLPFLSQLLNVYHEPDADLNSNMSPI